MSVSVSVSMGVSVSASASASVSVAVGVSVNVSVSASVCVCVCECWTATATAGRTWKKLRSCQQLEEPGDCVVGQCGRWSTLCSFLTRSEFPENSKHVDHRQT